MRRPLSHLFGLLLLAAPVSVLHAQSDPASPDFFETKIRPILAVNCYTCHTTALSGGLRLDSAEALAKGGDHGPSVTPGDPDKSLLITAVRQTDANLKMPMGGKLKDAEVADLAAWVKAGAMWPKTAPAAIAAAATAAKAAPEKYVIAPAQRQLWSLLPLKAPAAPEVKDPRWSKTDIDRFVFAKLEQQGLKPVPPASKRDLLRRATLDLTGLPPTPEELDAFEKDNSPDAFAKVVDRLLASPHYGERWGRVWLDVARYGEDDYRSLNPNPKGYRPYPNAYAYRDWVIQAFNDDLPYDQFVKAQLAGDLMDPAVRYKMLPGTGFLGLGPWYYDNGSNEVTRADERHDRVDVVTRGFLGLTVACARCHDHKYDPIPQTDYYSLAGVFFNTIYEEYPAAPKNVVDAYEKMQSDMDEKQKILQEATRTLTNELAHTYALQTSNYLLGVWDVTSQKKEKGAVVESRKLDYEVLDRWITYMGKKTDKYHNKDAWQAMAKTKTGGTQAEAKKLADKFQEEVIEALLQKTDLDAQNQIITDKDVEGTKPKKRTDKPSNFVSNKDFNPGSDLRLLSLPEEQSNFYTEIFQRELKDDDDPTAMMAAGVRQQNGGVLTFRGYALQSRLGPEAQARTKSMQDDIDAAKKKLDTHYPFIHGVKDAETPVNLPLALRGNPENLGPEVPRHFLSILSDGDPTAFAQGSGRMELANDIVKQPIAMRVIVNRIWKEHFDTGIVDTPSNFGQKGEAPTDPELLEYLADAFVKDGMSIKKLQRAIMLTQVYQLSTQNNAENYAKDSGDRFYWRANHHRLDAEELRDSVLAVAGNLDSSLGGPSEELTPANVRRTVYGKVSRYKLDTYLSTFDFPTPNISAEKRFVTTVPLQRLFLMNSDFMQLESEEMAKRVAGEPDNQARIKKAYQLIYGRQPTEAEIKLGIDYLHTEPMKEYEENKNKPPDPAAGGGRRGKGGQGGGGGKGASGGAAVTKVETPAGAAPDGADGKGGSGTTAVAKVEAPAADAGNASTAVAKVEVPGGDAGSGSTAAAKVEASDGVAEGSGETKGGSTAAAKMETPAGAAAEGSGGSKGSGGITAAAKVAKSETPASDAAADGEDKGGDAAVAKAEASAGDAATGEGAEGGAVEAAAMGDGMMGGVGGFGGGGGGGGRRGNAPAAAPVKYDPTPWGRYIKVLLSSSEFLFVN